MAEAKENHTNILFIGLVESGRATIANAYLGEAYFPRDPGVFSLICKILKIKEESDKTIIIAPGIYDKLSALSNEIKKSLTFPGKYKINFVLTSSRTISEHNIIAINLFCKLIDHPFEYGIIFNQIIRRVKDFDKDYHEIPKHSLKRQSNGWDVQLKNELNIQPSNTLYVYRNYTYDDNKQIRLLSRGVCEQIKTYIDNQNAVSIY